MSISPFFFSAIETHLLQEDLGKTIQTQKKQTSPQFWRSRHRGATQKRIFGSIRGPRCISCERVDPLKATPQLPQFLRIDTSFERVAFPGHQSTLPCCPQRKLRKTFWNCRCFAKLSSTCIFTSATLHLHMPFFWSPPVHTLLYLSIYLSICLSVCLSVCLPVCLAACLPACLPVSVCLSVCLSLCLSIYLYGPAALHLQIFMW